MVVDKPAGSRSLPGQWKLTGTLCPASSSFAPLLFAGRLEEGIRVLGALGYDAIELSLRHPSEVDAGWLLDVVVREGLVVSSIGTGRVFYEERLSISSPSRAARRECVMRLKEHLQLAARLGSALIIGGIRGVLPGDLTATTLRKEAMRALQVVADEAGSLGVQLLLEPINRYETNFIVTVEEALAFLEEARLPSVKLLLDTFHMNIEEVSIAGAIRLAGPRLGYVHLVDSNRRAPGCGHTDFASVLDALMETKFSGYLGMEVLPWPDDLGAARLALENTRALVGSKLGVQEPRIVM